VRRLRILARLRKTIAWVVLLAPPLFVLAVDLSVRGDRLLDLRGKYIGSYLGALVESTMLWGLLLYSASARRGPWRWISAVLFVALATITLGCQIYFQRVYSTYINLDALLFATTFSESLFGHLRADGLNFLTAVGPPLACAVVLVWLGRIVVRPRQTTSTRIAQLLAPVAVIAGLTIPCSY
jgi:hypothetical protein